VEKDRLKGLAETVLDFVSALEAACVKLRREIDEQFGPQAVPSFNWDPAKIRWVETEGFRGKYERYPAEGAKAEAGDDYKNLLVDLAKHVGRLSREGWFYWLFTDGSTVGRKLRPKAA